MVNLSIFVRKDDYISFNINCLHQDKDLWGADADTFRPERWAGLRPLRKSIPFGGGAKTCSGATASEHGSSLRRRETATRVLQDRRQR